MKIHLETVYGSPYCGVRISDTVQRATSNTMDKVTCARCIRRYHRLPLNAPVPKNLRERYGK